MSIVTPHANVSELAATAATKWPSTPALVDTASGFSLTWSQVDDAINTEAARLTAAGLEPKDRVIVRLPTSAAYAVEVFAVLRAGGIAVPLSPQAPRAELEQLAGHSGARFLVAQDGSRETAAAETTLAPPDLERASGATPVVPIGKGEDIAMLCYTTASKEAPRGVMLSHRALLANVDQVAAIRPAPVMSGDRVLVAIPLFHVYGLGLGMLAPAAAGATSVLAERFDARQALAECVRHEVTTVLGVPTMYTEFADLDPDELAGGLAGVRMLTSGAAPLRPRALAAIEEITGLGVYEGYGLTETAPVLTSTLVTGHPKPGSVGRPLPGVELKLVDDSGTGTAGTAGPDRTDSTDTVADPDDLLEDDEGVTGLVCVRGDNLFSGYWPDGEGGPDADGWFRTSDVGYLDTEGDLHLVDRANDLIIVNGFNVYPHEVEDVIAELPEVAEVAVVGMHDERSGESVKAVVVPQPSVRLEAQQVVEHCAAKLARYKVPGSVEFAAELPHTATGKLHRGRLRSRPCLP